MCHMRISLKAQTHFNTICNVWVISPPQRLAFLHARTALQMRLRHCPPIFILTTPYAFTPPPLPSLRLRMPSRHACNNAYHPYHCVVPSRHASNNTYDPYACVVPSQLASNTDYHPYTRGVPSQHAPDTVYHPYAHGAPSQHAPDTTHPYACVVPSRLASNTAYHPYAHGVPSRHCLPSLCLQSALPTCS
ncbi:hypothetical protein O181_024834 [Austropuccinia psidii MF-1]|uniref:Uncharacterized protein n=1 Tax=Austropuccinia psidii MF-1 TaxID=1389203 RepID=A0A9Q3CJE0_9BASI|nr:hypothetical protein [Austropuccinia psidii MF-1]